MNIANKLTLSRMIMVPFFLVAVYFEKDSQVLPISAIIFAVASFTDFLDGYLARKYNLITDFGKFMDPLADKVLVVAALAVLVEMNLIPAWMIVLIITREYAVSILRAIAANTGQVIAASQGGKAKTVSQIIAVLMLLLNIKYGIYVMWIAVILTFVSGMDYLMKNKKLISQK
ncbi:CDP-diacylglycerol--glycerol-3-phosphate 3-phosphatidyltransferase [Acetoanaerobium noterae]|jgi:CDP-diacylglycerol--glycerol-3-phosphate 3-phosphatidyltransferase|uniref:CDP-diacylglycerol--glycerol-3-phosphate 3-phosphatidyltransferase n=1 Tax=Acetoanaerobium noterae TaxID=745369 RepID=A0A1T4ZU67_9FIRM|nr:CDP-diacylglycerol--glycerol-3-phosphate 3-phosphatidyltransferase [Acetoanaerobium noterae]MBP8762359.1 CDP-diacylglycerol--glycerol-3-phosphate 3-phosphatidyltransferase [Acetoanaerobium sp.]MBP9499358.1 CDP-diacylglycerol--glycerol-3-phosphate 3-phosphatidyltransferase [Acetoanaerobium sp.]MBP9562300.1 CDP-diacylglycerol--glycerol-3-phosphate 3-phosphatidyltransferase [Acetoanaerobium sp.]SKB26301.1 CDP-diacylglycerol--glycerol-3-phosphate 3-phosphatidyltransferase [Acetoanaerobium notera